MQLARERLQFIAAVTIEQHELFQALPLQGIDQIGEHRQQSRRIDAQSQAAGNFQMIGVDAKRHDGKQQHLGAGLVSASQARRPISST